MTIATSPVDLRADDTAAWRALESGLWVARRDSRHIGAVQRGHRWVASDQDGEPIGAFRTLEEAQAAVADPGAHRAPIRSTSGAVAMFVTCVLGVLAVASAADWVGAALAR